MPAVVAALLLSILSPQADSSRFSISESQLSTFSVAFDHRNRLIKAEQFPDSITQSPNSSITYFYDPLDRRIAKEVSSSSQLATSIYFYNGDHIWKEQSTTNQAPRTVFFLHGDRIDQLLARHRSDDGLAFYLTDRMGSVRAIADTDGRVLSQTDYSAFGEIISQTSPGQADQFGFTGREFIRETGLYYYRARYYDPGLGRFISEDPIGFEAGDISLQRYLKNQPLEDKDPYGLFGVVYQKLSNFSKNLTTKDAGIVGIFLIQTFGESALNFAKIPLNEDDCKASVGATGIVLILLETKAIAGILGNLNVNDPFYPFYVSSVNIAGAAAIANTIISIFSAISYCEE